MKDSMIRCIDSFTKLVNCGIPGMVWYRFQDGGVELVGVEFKKEAGEEVIERMAEVKE